MCVRLFEVSTSVYRSYLTDCTICEVIGSNDVDVGDAPGRRDLAISALAQPWLCSAYCFLLPAGEVSFHARRPHSMFVLCEHVEAGAHLSSNTPGHTLAGRCGECIRIEEGLVGTHAASCLYEPTRCCQHHAQGNLVVTPNYCFVLQEIG